MNWPIPIGLILDVGESIKEVRVNKPQPHKGVDIHCAAGTPVLAAADGVVVAVVDGRRSRDSKRRAAGLFVDVKSSRYVCRYLHLGEVFVFVQQPALVGDALGTVAPAFTSGLAERPHLHFEVRRIADVGYGAPLDPLRLLPTRRS